MRHISIPRWLLIAMAALLVFAIFVIVVHPYYDVSKATVRDGLTTLILALALMQTMGAIVVRVPVAQRAILCARFQPPQLRTMERYRIRRI